MSRILLVLLFSLAAAACGRDSSAADATIPRQRFIDVNVALRQVDRKAENADSLREAVLTQHRVTEEELKEFISARAGRPLELSEIWDEIHRRLVETPPVDTAEIRRARAGTPADTASFDSPGVDTTVGGAADPAVAERERRTPAPRPLPRTDRPTLRDRAPQVQR